MQSKHIGWAFVTAGLLGLGILLWPRGSAPGDKQVTPVANTPAETPGEPTPAELAASPSLPGATADSDPGDATLSSVGANHETRAPATPNLVLAARDMEGTAIEGAVVSFHPVSPELLGRFENPVDDRWLTQQARRRDDLRAQSISTRTELDGRSRVPVDGLQPDSEWIAWVTHPGYEAVCTDPFDSLTQAELEVVLTETAPRTALVLDADGQPAVGAQVVQLALPPGGDSPAFLTEPGLYRRAFERISTTDAQGRVPIHSVESPMLLTASLGNLNAFPLVLQDEAEVTLQLRAVAFLAGHIGTVDGFELGQWAMVVASLIDRTTGSSIPIASEQVGLGSYGPIPLPLGSDASAYRVELLQGANAITRQDISPPSPGERIQVDFEARAGASIWVNVADNISEEPIARAQVTARWVDPAQPHAPALLNSVTQDNGWTRFDGLPLGRPIRFTGIAPGYQASSIQEDGFTLEDQAEGSQVLLRRTGSIRVRASSRDKPLQAFEAQLHCTSWPSPPQSAQSQSADSLPSEIAFADVAAGDYELLVTSPGLGFAVRSGLVVESGVEESVDIELNGLGPLARGRVVDSASDNPIPNAVISLPQVDPEIGRPAQGLRLATTDSAGWFEVPSFSHPDRELLVDAQSFEPKETGVASQDATGLNFGTIRLESLEQLELALTPTPAQPQNWAISLATTPQARTGFDGEGKANLALGRGYNHLTLYHPDGVLDHFTGGFSPNDGPVSLPILGKRDVEFLLPNPLGDATVDDTQLRLTCALDSGLVWTRNLRVPAGPTRIRSLGFPASKLLVEWLLNDGTIANKSEHNLLEELNTITLEFERRTFELVVQSIDGSPVVGAMAQVWSEQGGFLSGDPAPPVSTSKGLVQVPYPATETFSLLVRGGEPISTASIDSTQIHSGPSPYVITLGGDHAVWAEVAGPNGVIDGAMAQLHGPRGTAYLGTTNSSATGILGFEGLSEGSYQLSVFAKKHWSSTQVVSATAQASPRRIQLLAVADLTLEIVDAQGDPVSDFSPILRHEALNEDLTQWLGRPSIGSDLPKTDSNGLVHYPTLPAGTYSFTGPAPQETNYSFRIEPGSNRLEVQF